MFDSNIKFMYPWRPYQERVLKEASGFLRDGKINVVAAPGSGKTILGLELARRIGNPVIIFAPTVTIKKQWVSKFVKQFMQSDTVPDWISTDIYDLKFLNVVTYQALHYAYKRKKNREADLDDTDDVIEKEESIATDEMIKEYDIVSELKAKNITTLVLDEAHHLKSEWWKSLKDVVDCLGSIKLIALTATPPYDVEPAIWANYVSLCGEIDAEISVPELVKAKNLCPHQDFIYFNYPTESEIQNIKQYDEKLNEIVGQMKSDNRFIDAIYNHKFIKNPYQNDEEILNNPEYYSSMLVFLKYAGKTLDIRNVNILGHNNSIPNFDLSWFEILLKNVFSKDRKNFEEYEDVLSEYEDKLNKIGAIEKKNVSLIDNKTIQKYFVNSLGKLNSISKIVDIELGNMGQDMRMVVLTDYIRKEYLTTENIEIDKIGVLPIFKTIFENHPDLNMAVLTGGLFVVPKSKAEKLTGVCIAAGIDTDKIKYKDFIMNSDYVEVSCTEKIRNDVMNCISKLFEMGDIQFIVGTKSLLGEGWDEPSINTLVLATFVGSFMLSNQMRGRAIRVNSNPNKTSNIWHLVCVCDGLDKNSDIENTDVKLLERRFKSFTGIGYNNCIVSSGLERLGNYKINYSREIVDNFNQYMADNSKNRVGTYDNWMKAVEYKSDNMQMTEEIEMEGVEPFKAEWITPKGLFICIAFAIIMFFVLITGFVPRIISFVVEACLVGYIYFQYKRIKRLSLPENTVRAIGEVVLEALCRDKQIKTSMSKIKVLSQKSDNRVTCWIEGVTLQESNLFISCLNEVFTKVESQRYILSNRKSNIIRYYNVPNIFSNNKENAQRFASIWMKKIGKVELVYTKSAEGRKELLKARMQYLSKGEKISRRQKLSDWK
ncbi:MAG: DEAD/DEAH box helicase family protein [Clostridia bacterium]|nr:DEAD/DEAH box helicase family protein [Clostridia bacterium]